MSEISRAASAAPKPAAAPAAPANRGPAGKPNEARGDVFSALMSLATDTQAAPMVEATSGDAGAPLDETNLETEAKDPAQNSGENPLAQLLGWPDPKSTAGGATPNATAGLTPTKPPAVATAVTNTAADANAAQPSGGTNTTGTQPPAHSKAVDPAALPANATPAGAEALTNSTPRGAKTSVAADAAPLGATGTQPPMNPVATDPAALPPGAHPTTGRTAGAAATALGDARDARPRGPARRDVKGNTPADTPVALRTPTNPGQPPINASVRATAAAGGGEALRTRGVVWANSTVSMDVNATRDTDSVAGNAVSLTAKLSAMLAGQAPPDGAGPTSPLGATQDAGANLAEAPSAADALPGGEAAPEPDNAQPSPWSPQHLRHAHLRLGEGAQDSVDIRLSMQGQDLSVDFRTDNADIRQSLAQQANQSLTTLLERSGIALADVSVGAQHQQRQGQGQGGEPQGGGASASLGRRAAGRGEADPPAALRAPPAHSLRADGSRPLDLFV